MNLDDARTAVGKLLSATSIVAVYYVDDKFQEDNAIDDRFEEFQVAIEDCYQKGYTDSFPDNVRCADIDNLETETRVWWSNMTAEQKQLNFEKYVTDGVENIRPAILIKDVLESKCICCSPSKWNNQYKTNALSRIAKKESICLLFDQELSDGRNGFQYAESILSTPGAKDCAYCGIISNQFRTEDEFEKRNDYKRQLPDCYIYPLSKDRINEADYESFIFGLKNILWVKHIELIKNHTKEIFRQAFNKTLNRYLEIQPPAYKQIIFDSSQKEGCREIDTILRFIQIILDKEIKEAINEDTLSLINKEMNSISNIHDTDIISQYPEVDKQAKGFIKDERFIDGSIINALYTPLQNGDIFKFEDCVFILLCQPCNISIRNKGNRSNKYDTGFLVQLTIEKNVSVQHPLLKDICKDVKKMLSPRDKRINSEKLNSYYKDIQKLLALRDQLNFPLDFEIDGNKYVAQFNQFQTISLSLLDNVSFNKEGKAIIDFTPTDIPQGLHRNLIARRNSIKEQFEDWVKIKQNVTELCYDCQWFINIEKLLLKLDVKFKFEDIKSNKIILPIQRIGHYRSPYSDDLLTRFSHYISRAGFPHSFI